MSHAWATTLFDCCAGKDVGAYCCLQHCCCGPCVYGSALKAAEFKDATFYAVLLCCGGRSVLDEVAGYAARRRLVGRYDIHEDSATSLLLSCCCAPCARFQEVNTILVREHQTYGCASVVPDASPAAPVPAVMVSRTGNGRRI